MNDLPIKNQNLLERAFTHRSYLNETSQRNLSSNERLEYLGDAVLELAVSEYLFNKFPNKPEGELTSIRAALVKTTTLAEVSTRLNFGQRMLMSKGEENTGGRDNKSLLANTFEAVVGAIYLDAGFENVVSFLNEHLFPLTDDIIELNLHKDFKSTFQEVVQAQGHPTPTYQVIAEAGPDHDKHFTIGLYVGSGLVAKGEGKSKQAAQQNAAQIGLKKLDDDMNL